MLQLSIVQFSIFRSFKQVFVLVSVLAASFQVNADLILQTYGNNETPESVAGYALTDFDYTNTTGLTSVVDSPLYGSVFFEDVNSDSINLFKTSADDVWWWQNSEAGDYNIYLPNVSLITLILPENTRAFSFSVGARTWSRGQNAWLTATTDSGQGISDRHYFNINRNNTPSFAVYSDDPCGSVTSITIDPYYWGVGNFSINQGNCLLAQEVSVPEPGNLVFVVLAFFGMLLRRKLCLAK